MPAAADWTQVLPESVMPEIPDLAILEIWQCIGCGRIEEVPQTCIGVCRSAPRRMVALDDFRALTAERDAARAQAERYAQVLRLIATSTPRADACPEHWRALQLRARAVLAGTPA
jgi:ATP/maltotriose-dependent transcriptional regulator MalT